MTTCNCTGACRYGPCPVAGRTPGPRSPAVAAVSPCPTIDPDGRVCLICAADEREAEAE